MALSLKASEPPVGRGIGASSKCEGLRKEIGITDLAS
jgi:hypothetical protein